jgi:hypothetical protein
MAIFGHFLLPESGHCTLLDCCLEEYIAPSEPFRWLWRGRTPSHLSGTIAHFRHLVLVSHEIGIEFSNLDFDTGCARIRLQ